MTTGLAPFFLMLEREMRSKLPELGHEAPITNEEIRDWARKLTQKITWTQRNMQLRVQWKLEIKYY